jgi:hypothetical protein
MWIFAENSRYVVWPFHFNNSFHLVWVHATTDESIIWPKNLTDENAFQQIKRELASSGTLSHYDPNKESIVSADASSFGIGAVIRQKRGESLRDLFQQHAIY